MNTIAYLALIGATSAIQLNREPLLSADASPLEIHQSPKYWDTLVDYPVPNFGSSHEMVYTENNKKLAEAELGDIPMGDFDKTPWPHTDTTVEFKLL